MALTNFILTVAGVSAVVLLLRSDVKQTSTIFRRNIKQIRHWLEEESASASKRRICSSKPPKGDCHQLDRLAGDIMLDKLAMPSSVKDETIFVYTHHMEYDDQLYLLDYKDSYQLVQSVPRVISYTRAAEKAIPKEIKSEVPKNDLPKEDKH